MNLSNFLQELIIKGWKFWNEDNRLRYRAPKEESTSSVLAQLKEHKAEIIKLLQQNPSIFNVCPLSYGQRSLWFLWQLEPESHAYNTSLPLRICSVVDITAIQKAFEALRSRHPILRTSYPKLNSEPIQKVDDCQELDFLQIDASSWGEDELKTKVIESDRQPFDLERGPVMRVRWFIRSESEHILLLTMHHIAWDGWSAGNLLMQELLQLYQAQLTGVKASLPVIKYSYQDYTRWQRGVLQGSEGERLWKYWQSKLTGELPAINLPTDRLRPPIKTYNGASHKFKLSSRVIKQLKELAQTSGVTLYMILLAAFQVLLYRYTGQEDILVGSPTSGRTKPEFAPIVGYFVVPVVIRANLSNNPSFKEFLKQVRQTVLEALNHQEYPFALLVEKLYPHRDPSRSPIFQVSFTLHKLQKSQDIRSLFTNEIEKDIHWGGLKLRPFEIPQQEGQFDLTLEMMEGNSSLKGVFKYNTDLFDELTIERMAGHFHNLLLAIVENPDQKVAQLPLLIQAERHQLLVEWNDTATEYPTDECIHQLFEEQVEKTPDAIAVMFKEQQLTYEQLNQRANQLAHHLQTLGVKPEVLVGICVERSIEMVVGLLGILKAGGAYVPLDPNYPQERLSYMLSDSGVGILVTQSELVESLPEHSAQVVCLDSDWSVIGQQSQENIDAQVSPDNLAYVIYTSGSTGKPKGVAVEHQSPVALCHWARQTFSPEQLNGVLATTSICFDLSVFELFVSLCLGGKVIVADNGLDIPKHHHSTEITLINTVPSVIAQLLKVGGIPAQVMTVNLAGEPIQNSIVQKLYEHQNIQYVHNLYGPSEDTTYSTFAPLAKGTTNQPSIGRPIANTQVYILDKHLQPVPIGVPGELYIGGDGLARGYLNRPQLTQEKFIPNPFNKSQRVYKTGDLARYLPDGNIEFIGRIDNQVKIRGFRIELGEIEAVLTTHPQVNQAVVIAQEENTGNKRLVAYVVKYSELSNQQLRNYVKSKLPDYMVPSAFVSLDALPLNPNGKIDRKALPVPDTSLRDTEYAAPRTEVEQILTNIWEELLPVGKVGIHDNFFEIGGDSILSIQAISRAKNAGIQINAQQILQHQTIAELATVANTIVSFNYSQDIVTGVAPLTPIQHWFFEEQTEELHHYNQSVLLQIPSDIRPEVLEKAVEKLIEHHDALRLRFTQVASEYKQTNLRLDNKVPHTVIDLSETPIEEQPQAIERIASQFQASLNISTGSIMQVVMFKLGDIDGRLLIIIHHLVVDGVSWRILLADLEIIYQQLIAQQPIQLSPKTIAFIDWAKKLNHYAQLEIIKEELDYWLNQPWSSTTPLPLDYTDNQQQNTVSSAASVSVKLNPEETSILLGSVSEAYNTQINDILLSALSISLAEWTGNEKILIDLEGHGREEIFPDIDFSSTVGWFTSLFPVLLQLSENNALASVIKSIKEQLRAIPNRGIGYGILRYLCKDDVITEKLKTIPTPEISFNYLGQFDQIQSQTGWKFAPESTGDKHSSKLIRSHLLDIDVVVVEGELQINWTYSSNAHSHYTIKGLAQSYLKAIKSIIEYCQLEENFGYTPSDFPNAQLNQLELDKLLDSLDK